MTGWEARPTQSSSSRWNLSFLSVNPLVVNSIGDPVADLALLDLQGIADAAEVEFQSLARHSPARAEPVACLETALLIGPLIRVGSGR